MVYCCISWRFNGSVQDCAGGKRQGDVPVEYRDFVRIFGVCELKEHLPTRWAATEEDTGIPRLLRFLASYNRQHILRLQHLWKNIPITLLDLYRSILNTGWSTELCQEIDVLMNLISAHGERLISEMKTPVRKERERLASDLSNAREKAANEFRNVVEESFSPFEIRYQSIAAVLRHHGVFKNYDIPALSTQWCKDADFSQRWRSLFSAAGFFRENFMSKDMLQGLVMQELETWRLERARLGFPPDMFQDFVSSMSEVISAELGRFDIVLQEFFEELPKAGLGAVQKAETRLFEQIANELPKCICGGRHGKKHTISAVKDKIGNIIQTHVLPEFRRAVSSAFFDLRRIYSCFFDQLRDDVHVRCMAKQDFSFGPVKERIVELYYQITRQNQVVFSSERSVLDGIRRELDGMWHHVPIAPVPNISPSK